MRDSLKSELHPIDSANLGFFSWVRKGVGRVCGAGAAIVVLVGSVASLLRTTSTFTKWIPESWANALGEAWVMYAIQAIIILVFLALSIPNPLVNRDFDKRAARAVDQFQDFWLVLLASWLFLYGFQAVAAALNVTSAPPTGAFIELVWNFFANCANAAMLLLFLVMARPTGEWGRRLWVYPFLVVAVFSGLESIGVLGGFTTLSPIFTLPMLYSVLGGVSLALLVGRLENKLLETPLFAIALLYSYAVIQFAQAFFSEARFGEVAVSLKPVMTSIALLLKIVLFLVCLWAMRSGRLFCYMSKIRETHLRAEEARHEFFEKCFGSDASKTAIKVVSAEDPNQVHVER